VRLRAWGPDAGWTVLQTTSRRRASGLCRRDQTPKDRRQHRDALNALTGEITAAMTSDALIERLNTAGIPCGPIYTIDQTFADPQVRHLGIAQAVQSSALGAIDLVGQPFTLSRTPSRLVTGAPEYGEHTDEILLEIGYSRQDVAQFRQSGAV
jgi:crotonobetainyl-CoA:carnitine CoA-transferase CaiB-like acyl-CoA transferase